MKVGFCGNLFHFLSTEELFDLAVSTSFEIISLGADQIMRLPMEKIKQVQRVTEVCWHPRMGISLLDACRTAIEAGIRTLVVPAEESDRYKYELLRVMEESGMIIALENGFGGCDVTPFEKNLYPTMGSTADDLADLCSLLNAESGTSNFKVCLNTGHAVICGQNCGAMVRRLGKLIISVHANDNYTRNDYHLPPFRGRDSVDWEDFFSACRELVYNGDIYIDADDLLTRQNAQITKDYFSVLYNLCYHIKDRIEFNQNPVGGV